MNATSVPYVPGRHFSNAVITWKISNVSLALCFPKTICSPQIILSGPIETLWRLSLRILKEKDKAVMYLEMLPNDYQTTRVRVNWASYVLDENGEGSFVQERSHSFEPHCKLAVQMFRLGRLSEKLKIATDDLKLQCHMLVQFGFNPVFPKTRVEGVLSLSTDLSVLPKSFLHNDVIYKVGSATFSLHRAMLCRRSEKLSQLIKEPPENMIVDLPFSNAEAAEALLTYLYTCDLTYILSRPSLTICDYIEKLSIPELKKVYPKDIMKVESKIDAKEYDFSWMINDFRNAQNPIASTELYKCGMKSRWQLYLYPNRSTDGNERCAGSVYIESVLVDSEESLDACLEFSCVKNNGQIAYSRRIQGRMAVGSKLGLPFFQVGSEEVDEYLINGALSLFFTVRIATGNDFSLITENEVSPSMPINNEQSLMFLSGMMGLLMTSHNDSDFLFEVEDRIFKTHKFVVAARSPIFQELLRRDERAVSTKIIDGRKDVFYVFLSYMYMGIITESDIGKLMELYDMGDVYQVYSLKRVCANLLYKFLRKENVLRILVFSDCRNESKLKTAALKLIQEVGDSIKDDPYWYYLKARKPALHAVVQQFIEG